MIRTAVILSTGDELTSGVIVDTNANFLADKLFAEGIDLVTVMAVGDRRERIRFAFETGLDLADVVVATGGLGPTADDLTTETVAETLGMGIRFEPEVAESIRALFRKLGRDMPENNLRQANFPETAVVLPNPDGTAPGYRVDVEWKGKARHVVVMPGVPREMKPMFENHVLPWIRSQDETGEVNVSRTFQTFGASESALDEMLVGAIPEDEARLSFRAAFPQISVRVTAHAKPEVAAARLDSLAKVVHERLGHFVFAEGAVTMERLVHQLLAERGWTLAVAESCSGGLVAHRLTDVPGGSATFAGGTVAYTPEAKVAQLGVQRETIERHGIVSEETAREMAAGARRIYGADVAVSTTGVAGPDGGTAETPVGTVIVALAAEGVLAARRYQLWGARDWIKLLTSQIALDWVRRQALGLPITESTFIKR